MSYCFLADAKSEIKADSTRDDDMVMRYIRQTCARINTIMDPRRRRPIFEPYIEQRSFVLTPRAINSTLNSFTFKQPLLSIASVLVGSQDVSSTIEAFPSGQYPIKTIRFVGGAHSWYEFCSSFDPVYVHITGTWGIHTDYSNAWVSYDTIQTNPLQPADVTFAVADANGDDPYGIAPRFSPGQLLRIGDGTEILRVSAVNETTNIVSAQRAQNGSSLPSSNYAAGSAVKVFEPEEQIRRVVARQAGLMYARKGAYQTETLDGVGAVSYPQDLLIELQSVLTEYQYI